MAVGINMSHLEIVRDVILKNNTCFFTYEWDYVAVVYKRKIAGTLVITSQLQAD